MKRIQKVINNMSFITLYRLRWVALIALSWTLIELLLYYRAFFSEIRYDYPFSENIFSAYLLRAVILLVLSSVMAWLLLVEWRVRYRNMSMIAGWSLKTILLLLTACFTIAFITISHFMIIKEQSFSRAMHEAEYYFFQSGFFIDSLFSWILIILVTQVVVEVDQKYSPGVFWQILTGKYVNPKTERRIIMFLDLKGKGGDILIDHRRNFFHR
jgi:adenylate cyclase